MLKRCNWAFTNNSPLYLEYHDKEWGVPLHEDGRLFELLTLEAMQAGLSWFTILRKRENFRKAFDYFDPTKIAKYDNRKLNELLNDQGIVRNRLKVSATIQNAKSFLMVKKKFGSFDKYVWSFAENDKPKKNHWKNLEEIPSRTKQSDFMSKDMSQRNFKFVGSTICYAYMQSIGIVNDHITSCFRYNQL